MARSASVRAKIPTDSPQPFRKGAARAAGRPKAASRPAVLAGSTGRSATRGGGEVIELECGITVYPARSEGGRWRAVWHEDGERLQCEAATEEKLAPKLAKVAERLQADAPNMRKPGAALIRHYLDPDRLPVHQRWSRRHADTQRRLCERFAAPVIAEVGCQDIKTEHTQKIVNAAPTAGEGDRIHRMVSAMVTVGLDGGYLVDSGRHSSPSSCTSERPGAGRHRPAARGRHPARATGRRQARDRGRPQSRAPRAGLGRRRRGAAWRGAAARPVGLPRWSRGPGRGPGVGPWAQTALAC
jgi:hypothetical protein